jgi:hypothetical protein
MSDHSDERLQRTAHAMKQAFFAEFGHPDTLSEGELGECMASLVSIHVGALIECAARFRGPDQAVRDICIDFIDRMLEVNADVVAEMMDDRSPLAFLKGDQKP